MKFNYSEHKDVKTVFVALLYCALLYLAYSVSIFVAFLLAILVAITGVGLFFRNLRRIYGWDTQTFLGVCSFALIWSSIFTIQNQSHFNQVKPESLFGTLPVQIPLVAALLVIVASAFAAIGVKKRLLSVIFLAFLLTMISLIGTSTLIY